MCAPLAQTQALAPSMLATLGNLPRRARLQTLNLRAVGLPLVLSRRPARSRGSPRHPPPALPGHPRPRPRSRSTRYLPSGKAAGLSPLPPRRAGLRRGAGRGGGDGDELGQRGAGCGARGGGGGGGGRGARPRACGGGICSCVGGAASPVAPGGQRAEVWKPPASYVIRLIRAPFMGRPLQPLSCHSSPARNPGFFVGRAGVGAFDDFCA